MNSTTLLVFSWFEIRMIVRFLNGCWELLRDWLSQHVEWSLNIYLSKQVVSLHKHVCYGLAFRCLLRAWRPPCNCLPQAYIEISLRVDLLLNCIIITFVQNFEFGKARKAIVCI